MLSWVDLSRDLDYYTSLDSTKVWIILKYWYV
jgi:hypothetical protein